MHRFQKGALLGVKPRSLLSSVNLSSATWSLPCFLDMPASIVPPSRGGFKRISTYVLEVRVQYSSHI